MVPDTFCLPVSGTFLTTFLRPRLFCVADIRRELLTVKLRYKRPNESQSQIAEVPSRTPAVATAKRHPTPNSPSPSPPSA
jgi:hypothetical protein